MLNAHLHVLPRLRKTGGTPPQGRHCSYWTVVFIYLFILSPFNYTISKWHCILQRQINRQFFNNKLEIVHKETLMVYFNMDLPYRNLSAGTEINHEKPVRIISALQMLEPGTKGKQNRGAHPSTLCHIDIRLLQ
jgi:hypothetical protein